MARWKLVDGVMTTLMFASAVEVVVAGGRKVLNGVMTTLMFVLTVEVVVNGAMEGVEWGDDDLDVCVDGGGDWRDGRC